MRCESGENRNAKCLVANLCQERIASNFEEVMGFLPPIHFVLIPPVKRKNSFGKIGCRSLSLTGVLADD